MQRLTQLLILTLHGRAAVRCQLPFAALEFSEPEPDLFAPPGDHDTAHPTQAQLVIEVAETSLAKDRGQKLALYASCAVPEYWVVNLSERCIEAYTGAGAGAYAQQVGRFEPGQAIRLLAFPDVAVAVADVLK